MGLTILGLKGLGMAVFMHIFCFFVLDFFFFFFGGGGGGGGGVCLNCCNPEAKALNLYKPLKPLKH